MKRIQPHSLGLAFAALLAIWHVLWSLLVAVGAGQPVIDFIFRLHMIAPPYQVAGFNLGTAAGLVVFSASIGYVVGWTAVVIWNRCIPRDAGF